jgi:ribosomal-protein-serine acetyltransferase
MIWFPPFEPRGQRENVTRATMYDAIAIDAATVLVPLADVDPAALAAVLVAEHPRLAKDLPRFATIRSADDVRAYVHATRIATMSGRWLDFVLVVDGAIAGGIGLHEIDPFARGARIVCWLDRFHEGCGLATRALETLVALAFDEYRIARLELRVSEENLRAHAALERNGFVASAGAAGMLRYVREAESGSTSATAYAAIPLPSPV